jgi:hypothetical protein
MITIDSVDDNYDRTTGQVVQKTLLAPNVQSGSFDAAYASARTFYDDLLRVAYVERQASQARMPGKRDVIVTLNRIARALTAWL